MRDLLFRIGCCSFLLLSGCALFEASEHPPEASPQDSETSRVWDPYGAVTDDYSNLSDPQARTAEHYARVFGEHQAAVASVNPLATQAGLQALAQGGNAVDAALAVAFTLGVVDSQNSGIGGGLFVLARLADGQVIALDGREMAPAQAWREMFLRDGEPQAELSRTGALAAGVPGSVAALHALQAQAGALSFADVLLPAADLAEQGIIIDASLASRLERTQEALRQFPASAKIYLRGDGTPWQAGDRLVQKDLARSYRQLAEQGPDWFYHGEFAQRTARWMAEHGGLITEQDFADYRLLERSPIRSEYLGYEVYGFPPPSSGGVHVAQMLNMLAHYDLAALDEVTRFHLLAEVMRRAFADRAHWLGDADFVPVPRGLMAPEYAAEQIQDLDLTRATEAVTHGQPPKAERDLFDRHTTHFATADAQGNWVAVTSTLNTSFGSKVVVPGTGVLLNNQMDDFVSQPGVPNVFGLVGAEANSIEPGKRPLSSMSPTLVTLEGQPVLSVGAAGGPTIISQVLQTLVRHLALQQPLDAAVAGQRVHHQWRPNTLFVERTASQETRQALEDLGHTLREMGAFGGTQAIGWRDGQFLPITEPRIIQRNLQE